MSSENKKSTRVPLNTQRGTHHWGQSRIPSGTECFWGQQEWHDMVKKAQFQSFFFLYWHRLTCNVAKSNYGKKVYWSGFGQIGFRPDSHVVINGIWIWYVPTSKRLRPPHRRPKICPKPATISAVQQKAPPLSPPTLFWCISNVYTKPLNLLKTAVSNLPVVSAVSVSVHWLHWWPRCVFYLVGFEEWRELQRVSDFLQPG